MESEVEGMDLRARVKVRRRRTAGQRWKLALKLAVAVVITGAIGTAVWAVIRRDTTVLLEAPAKADTPAAKPGFFEIIHPKNEAAEKAAALRVFEDFRLAATWQEKLRFVRQPERVRPLMQGFYETHHRAEPVVGGVGGKADGLFVRGTGTPVLHTAFQDRTIGEMAYADVVRQPDGAYLLDWESFVGAGDMDWEDFMQARPTQPQLMRCILSESDYYDYEFADEKRYLSLSLVSRDGELFVNAFCERESDLGRQIAAHLRTRREGANRATVRVAFPEKAQSDSCVRLVELVADRWVLLD